MAFSGNRGFIRIIKASQYSWQGLCAAYRHEEAFRQEVWLSMLLIPLGLWLGQDGVERSLLVVSVLLLPLVEILNSSIEAVVDRFGEEQHVLAGAAKDLGSAAVWISLIFLGVVWVAVIYDRFYT